MNTLVADVFTDSTAEFVNIHSSTPSIDFTDSPIPPSQIGPDESNPNFLVTAPVAQTGYYEIQYMLANNFWGCNFQLGNSACGIQIRQGIAHTIDKTSFTQNDLNIAGISTPLDKPVPNSSGGGLPTPNPCAYDSSFPESGSTCVVGAPGGTAYHLNSATGADGFPWLYAPGSTDLDAAAYHLVTALSSLSGQSRVGCDGAIGASSCLTSTDSKITGVNTTSTIGFVTPTYYVRNDDPVRRDLGTGLIAQLCYLFTGSYTQPCVPYLNTVFGPNTAFPGFTTCISSTCLNWWIYTAAYTNVPFFDDSLYFTYNSRFASASCASPGTPSCATQQIGGGFCSNQSLATASAADYMYLCNPNYDSLTTQMENAPCLTSPQDPATGQPDNGPGGDCAGTSQLSAISLGIQAEAAFGAGAYTLPVFERTIQYEYLNNGWIRVVNDAQVGLPNYFTWLNVYNPAPVVPGTIRLGLSETTRSLNPYIASTTQDLFLVTSVYDSLYEPNPLATSQLNNWMSMRTVQLSNSSLTYTPPAHTFTTYRFTLRPDMYFQDDRPVTSYDVAFSYLSLVGSGAYLGVGGSAITGITILGPRQFDIGVNSIGPFVLDKLTTLPIIPGRYWTSSGSTTWDNAVVGCSSGNGCSTSQYILSGSTVNCAISCSPFSAALMTVDPAKVTPTFDPVASHIFVGSGPWECGTVTSSGSGTCTPQGIENAPVGGSYTLTRFGAGFAPASSISGIYFRSSGGLALAIWSEENDISPIEPLAAVSICYGQPVSLGGSCGHWQQGMGASSNGVVGVNQVAEVALRYGFNSISPFEWATGPPTGIGTLPPVLYEGSATLNPSTVFGCGNSNNSLNGYDC